MIRKSFLAALFCAAFLFTTGAVTAAQKTYQVTGPVLELTDTKIVVKKGKDRWEINRDATTKVTGDLKVGEKVTIEYTMSATDILVKGK